MEKFSSTSSPPTIEQLVESCVERTIERSLAPYLLKLCAPEPLVYTMSQAAAVLQVSPDTVSRLVSRGVLDRVPHIDGKMLIPRRSVESFVTSGKHEFYRVSETSIGPRRRPAS